MNKYDNTSSDGSYLYEKTSISDDNLLENPKIMIREIIAYDMYINKNSPKLFLISSPADAFTVPGDQL